MIFTMARLVLRVSLAKSLPIQYLNLRHVSTIKCLESKIFELEAGYPAVSHASLNHFQASIAPRCTWSNPIHHAAINGIKVWFLPPHPTRPLFGGHIAMTDGIRLIC